MEKNIKHKIDIYYIMLIYLIKLHIKRAYVFKINYIFH